MDRNGRSVRKEKRTQVIHPDHVIKMMMGYQHSIQLSYAGPNGLSPEIRSNVNQDMYISCPDIG